METLESEYCEEFPDSLHDIAECKGRTRTREFEVSVSENLVHEFVGQVSSKARFYRFCLKVPSLQMIAEELFSNVEIHFDSDIEIPEDKYLVFRVEGQGTPRRLADLRIEWYEKTDALLEDDCKFVRLNIVASKT